MIAYDAGLLIDAADPLLYVHHLNGDKLDNRIENLAVMLAEDHQRDHVHEKGYVTNQFGTFPLRTR